MIPLIERHHAEIEALCRRFGVRRLEVFGSAATGDFRDATSDLDFLVELAQTTSHGYAKWDLVESKLSTLRHEIASLLQNEWPSAVRRPRATLSSTLD